MIDGWIHQVKIKVMALTIIFLLVFGFAVTSYGLPNEQVDAIQSFLDQAARRARTPGISVAVLVDGQVHIFSTGVENSNTDITANEETLWELASVSKAFTALGILYLEELGYLSLYDSIQLYLPWLTLKYNGQPVDMQNVRLHHFMHHTVGITNQRHPNPIFMNRTRPDTLQDTVEALIGAELEFYPGDRYSIWHIKL